MDKNAAKEKLDDLREGVSERVKHMGGRDGELGHARDRVSERMSDVSRAAGRKLERAEQNAEMWARRADDELSERAPKGLERQVRRYPLFTVMASLCIGLVAGLLVGSMLGGASKR